MKKFTLIELLVVIAIIGILASLLLPGLAKARDAALTKVCLANIKQMSLAFQMYCDDSSSFMPARTYGDLSINQSWPCSIDPYAGGEFDKDNTDWRNFSGRGDSRIWRDPATTGTPGGRCDVIDYAKTTHFRQAGETFTQEGYTLEAIDDPSGQMLFADASDSGNQNDAWAWTAQQLTSRAHGNNIGIPQHRWNNYVPPRHLLFKKQNIGFFDGSARINTHADKNTPSILKLYFPDQY